MSLDNFEERINGGFRELMQLMKYVKNNESFFRDISDNYIYKPWINFVIYNDQNTFDKFVDSDLSWNYIGKFDFKIKQNGLRDEKIKDVVSIITYNKLLNNYCEELPLNFIEHYANIDDECYALFWGFIELKNYDVLKKFSSYYTWDPTVKINTNYDLAEQASTRNHNNSKHGMFLQMKKSIEGYTDDYIEDSEEMDKEAIMNLMWKMKEDGDKSSAMLNLLSLVNSSTTNEKTEQFYKSIEINEDTILDILWKIETDGVKIDILLVMNYFDFMSMSERIEWWNRIQSVIPGSNLKGLMTLTSSEVFLDHAENILADMEFDSSAKSSIINVSEAFVNRMIKKKPELKDDLIKYALSNSNNFGMLKYLLPHATSNDILQALEIKID